MPGSSKEAVDRRPPAGIGRTGSLADALPDRGLTNLAEPHRPATLAAG